MVQSDSQREILGKLEEGEDESVIAADSLRFRHIILDLCNICRPSSLLVSEASWTDEKNSNPIDSERLSSFEMTSTSGRGYQARVRPSRESPSHEMLKYARAVTITRHETQPDSEALKTFESGSDLDVVVSSVSKLQTPQDGWPHPGEDTE
jgi:hypothetical protein